MRQFVKKPRFLNDSEAEQGNHNPKVASSNLATATTNPQSPKFNKDCKILKFKEKCLIVFDSLKIV